MSGWGKSFHGQAILEAAIPEFVSTVVLDYKDEYRGLVKAGLLDFFIVGPREAEWSVDDWRLFLQSNPTVVLARYQLGSDAWREVSANIIEAARGHAGPGYPTLIAVDEAHIAAPEQGKVPEATKNLATTGRGEGASSLWMDQRASALSKDVLTQADETIIGGFKEKTDRNALSVEYPVDVHNPALSTVSGLDSFPELMPKSGEPVPLRRFEDEDGSTIGSEWIYANDKGEVERRNTRDMEMESTHFAPEGFSIPDPTYN